MRTAAEDRPFGLNPRCPEASFEALPIPMIVATDYFNIDSALSEEERAVRDSVRKFVDDRIMPIIGDAYVQGKFPKQIIPGLAELGVFGANLPEE